MSAETLPTLLAERAGRDGPRPALTQGELRWSWRELAEDTARIGGGLAALGVGSGDRVALALPNGALFTASFLAVASRGAVVVPLSTHFRELEITRALRDFEVSTVVTDAANESLQRSLADGRNVALATSLREFNAPIDRGTSPAVAPDDAAMFQFSSGSTGGSKRIARSHGQLVAEARSLSESVAMARDDRILVSVPLFHSYGLGNALLAPLASGAEVILFERFERAATLAAIEEHAVTILPAVPFVFGALCRMATPRVFDLGSLRLCMSAGAPLDAQIHAEFRARFGVSIRQQYGSTETGVIAIEVGDDPDTHAQTVGHPVRGVTVRIVDERGAELPVGSAGQVTVASPAMTDRYWGREDLTREHFRDGRFFTGDLGRLGVDGRLTLLGRQKVFIDAAAHKIDPEEVEAVLSTHPAVAEAIALGVPADFGSEAVKAVVVLAAPCSADELRAHCRGRIADYKVPDIIEFRDAIPRSPMGKVLRKYLAGDL